MEKVAVLGLGKVGSLAATLLKQSGFHVVGHDLNANAVDFDFDVKTTDVSSQSSLKQALENVDAVLSCLPYYLNLDVVKVAKALGLHYFDLTEDVPTTHAIIEMSSSSKGLMAPQCGLAPGFVGIVGADLISKFDECRSCRMRVGALPQHPTGLMGYSFNWSPEGVVNEYLNDCEVIENGHRKFVSAMEWKESIFIDGMQLEAFTTSGGLGTMCETYADTVANLDYKSMRYPGHMDLMNFYFHELLMREDRKKAGEILVNAKPPVSEDVVYVHVSAEALIRGKLQRKEFVRAYKPVEIAGKMRTAISWTTAASVVAIIDMVRSGALPDQGFLKQEDVSLSEFLLSPTGSYYEK